MNDCVFCKVINGELLSWKVYENENVLAFFDVNLVNEYHILVIPKQHHKDIFTIPEDQLTYITSAIKKITSILKASGYFAIALKQGECEECPDEKMENPRYFRYWTEDELTDVLTNNGFVVKDMTERVDGKWLYCIARLQEDK